jgi:uncharacterized membrane protein YuzA (DUF378 family)
MKMVHLVSYTLVIVGALNWGLVGLFGFNLVTTLLGSMPQLEMIVYVLVGVSAVYEVLIHSGTCKSCMDMMKKKK